MFGEGTDWENNKKPYFPLTGGSVLDNGGCMNDNQFMGLRIRWWRMHEQH